MIGNIEQVCRELEASGWVGPDSNRQHCLHLLLSGQKTLMLDPTDLRMLANSLEKRTEQERKKQEQKIIAYVMPYASRGGKRLEGFVLEVSGSFVEDELSNSGSDLTEWNIIGEPHDTLDGIRVWEGVCVNSEEVKDDLDEPVFRGTWRMPTTDEVLRLGGLK